MHSTGGARLRLDPPYVFHSNPIWPEKRSPRNSNPTSRSPPLEDRPNNSQPRNPNPIAERSPFPTQTQSRRARLFQLEPNLARRREACARNPKPMVTCSPIRFRPRSDLGGIPIEMPYLDMIARRTRRLSHFPPIGATIPRAGRGGLGPGPPYLARQSRAKTPSNPPKSWEIGPLFGQNRVKIDQNRRKIATENQLCMTNQIESGVF